MMSTFRKTGGTLGIGMAILLLLSGRDARAAGSVTIQNNLDVTAKLSGQLQILGALEMVDDPWNDSTRLFLYMRQARPRISGSVNGAQYAIEWMMGGEEVPKANSVVSLLDAYVDIPLGGDVWGFKFGQYKVPYSRERLQRSGGMLHTTRSIQNNYFNIGRDVGMALHTRRDEIEGTLGLFTGGGSNVPERYIPESIKVPMFAARFGWNSGLDQDVFTPYDTEYKPEDGVVFAAYLNGLYTRDSRVGHSTPLLVKNYDKSVMLQKTWNPYISEPEQTADFSQYGADVAARIPIDPTSSFLLTAEANVSTFKNDVGSLQNTGGTAGAYWLTGNWSIGIRYAIVNPDPQMAYTEKDAATGVVKTIPITDKPIQELAPTIAYNWPKYHLRVIADIGYQKDVPVVLEKGHGVYNLMRQPEQITYATSGGIELQDNYIANLVVQFNF